MKKENTDRSNFNLFRRLNTTFLRLGSSKMANKFQATAMLFFLISALLGRLVVLTMYTWTLPWLIATLLVGSSTVVSFGLGAVCLFFANQHVSEHQGVFSAFFHFIITYYTIHVGRKGLKHLRKGLLSPRQAQEKRLKEIITQNKNTVYGITFKLKNIQNLRDLKEKHPLTKYDHYELFVQKIAKGEKNVMTTKVVNRLLLTSGTTGKGKLIPRNMDGTLTIIGLIYVLQQKYFPTVRPLQKIFRIHCNSKLRKSESGITIAAGMVVERETAKFMPMFSTPPDGFMIESINEAFYIHFLFALREKHLGSTMVLFSSMFVDGFQYFEEHWPLMVKDIEDGTINKDLNIPPYIRETLERAIRPGDVQRAEEVRRECENGQQGILKRLWPLMEYVVVVDNIGIRNTLMKTVGKGLHFYAPLYRASEALVGLNFNPLNKEDEDYVLMVTDNIYEFIPEDNIDEPEPETYLIDEVKVGKNYELVISQMDGLYRYRFGDVVQITGYYENTPKVKFMYRTATLLNLFGEKVDQPTIIEALTSALGHLPEVEMKHYCVAESTMLSGLPEYSDAAKKGAHYVFFLEIKTRSGKGNPSFNVDTAELAKDIDDSIYNGHAIYRSFRDKNRIHACNVFWVKAGAFQELKEFILASSSASEVQFKMPQKLRTTNMATIMLRNRIK